MNSWSRRRFLLASGVAGAAVAGAGAVTWSQVFASGITDPKPMGQRTLVMVTLYGGNDGLNTLIPYADPAYRKARPDLAYDPADVLHLDGEFGLNPSMKNLARMWGEHRLAIVRGVGYPKPDHSHFRSMDIWQTAAPQTPVNTGWIGRWLDATGDDPLRAVNIGSVLPPGVPRGDHVDVPRVRAGDARASARALSAAGPGRVGQLRRLSGHRRSRCLLDADPGQRRAVFPVRRAVLRRVGVAVRVGRVRDAPGDVVMRWH